MDSNYTDLDSLLPEAKKVKLNNQILTVYPAKLKTMFRIMKAFNAFNKPDQDQEEVMNNLINALAEIIPDIKKDEVDMSIEQLTALVTFVYKTALPADIAQDAEKKMNEVQQIQTSNNQ